MHIRRWLCLLAALVCFISGAGAECPVVSRIADPAAAAPFAADAQLLEIWFPQMTDCDAAVICLEGQTWVLDCATEYYGERLVKLLDALGTERIEAVYNSHPHHDHLNGFHQLAEKYEIGELSVCFPQDYNEVMIAAVETAAAKGIPVTAYASGDVLTLGGASMEVYMTGQEDWSLNNQSAMMWLRYGDATMLFTADLEQRAQKYIAQTLPEGSLKVDVLKYPHHGLEKMSRYFVDAVDPLFSVITGNNRVYDVRYDLGIRKVDFTFTNYGYIRLATDGHTWLVEMFQEDQLPAG